jgi:HD-like signal output (HDOD) protein
MIKAEDNRRNYFILFLVTYSVLVFLYSVFLKYTYSLSTQELFGALSTAMASSSFSDWAPTFRRYAHYIFANFELMIAFLLIIPITRYFGALLGLIIISATLIAHILTSVGMSFFIDLPSYRVGGLSFALSIGAWFALLSLLFLPKKVAVKQKFKPSIKIEENSAPAPQIIAIEELVSLDRDIPFETSSTLKLDESFNQIIFDLKRNFHDLISGQHKEVLAKANELIPILHTEPKYLPRRPMIIPKLLRAVNNEDSTKKDLVEVIGQDPVLTGELLRVANSPFFRISEEPVDSIGRAIVILGIDGLKSLASTLVMMPIIQVKISYFPEFSKNIWLEAVKAALAAQAYARKTKSCDSFTAHLLGLLGSIGHIIIFKMLLDVYKNFSGLHPEIDVLCLLRRRHANEVTASVVREWGMSDGFVGILVDHQNKIPVNDMQPLGRALYYGHLCATLHMNYAAGKYKEEQVRAVVQEQGLHPDVFDAMWKVVCSEEASLMQ